MTVGKIDWNKWEANIGCLTYITGDIQTCDCPFQDNKNGRCVNNGDDCEFFMGIDTVGNKVKGRKNGCCWFMVSESSL